MVHQDPASPDISFALGWNFWPGTKEHTTVGELEARAKWKDDQLATHNLVDRMNRLVDAHDELRATRSIVFVRSTKALSSNLAEGVAQALGGVSVIPCEKANSSLRQSSSEDPMDYQELRDRMKDELTLDPSRLRDPVLIVDDLYRSGSTILEVCRCVREHGINRVFCLTAAKTVQFHQQT